MARKAGTKNRTYPPLTLEDALRVPATIQDQASGMTLTRLTLAELLKVSPSSSNFRDLVSSARLYSFTSGGINSDEFGLTPLGESATGADEGEQFAARKSAVMNIEPYKEFFERFKNKKVPGNAPFREFLTKTAQVPEDKAEECMQFILADAVAAGLIRKVQGGDWIDLSGARALGETDTASEDSVSSSGQDEEAIGKWLAILLAVPGEPPPLTEAQRTPAGTKKLFIAHGTNRVPLEQLKKALDQFR